MTHPVTRLTVFAMPLLALIAACDDAEVASRNISRASDNFEVDRRIVFYNGVSRQHPCADRERVGGDAGGRRRYDLCRE